MIVSSPGAEPARPSLADRWRSLKVALKNLPRALRLVWQTSPALTLVLSAVTLLSAGLPAAQAWVAKLIVDAVVAALTAGQPAAAAVGAVLPLLLLEFALVAAGAMLREGASLAEHQLSRELAHTVNVQLITRALGLDLHYFEDAAFYDKLQNARNEAGWRSMQIARTTFSLVQSLLTMASFLFILLSFSPLIAALLLAASLPAFAVRVAQSNAYYSFQMGNTPESRKMVYMEYLLTTDESAKEIKLFGLGGPLLQRYRALYQRYAREDGRLARNRSAASAVLGLLATASYYGAYAWIVWETLQGRITLGDMTLYIAICGQAQGTFQAILYSVGEVYEGGLFLENLFAFLATTPTAPASAPARPLPRPIRQGITFERVSFRYPSREEYALRALTLHIAPGEKLALVGENGAGKTTLVKLLTRLYEPTEGRILLDGVDLREYDLDDLRRRVGVIFQDFVHYYATLRENVGFGQIADLDDEARVLAAAERGGADGVARTLPERYDTVLGSWWERGIQLSGGQWQKIALSRAFMRDGEVLILDEPTAALDAGQEYAIFQRFHELTAGKIAVLISHRFSTVRMADRILVLEGGALAELGSHDELMALGGTYARLFTMQAEGYR